jgi:uracil DNA glycosylase
MADWYHPACFFDAMMRALAKTPVPMSADDIKGWEDLSPADEAVLMPLLDDFVKHRKAKVAGTLPKKPKAPKSSTALPIASFETPSKVTPTSATDWFSPGPAKTPKISHSPAPPAKPTDKFGLKTMLDTRWYSILSPLLEVLPTIDQLLSTFSPNFPNKALLFESIRNLKPSETKVIMIQDRPISKAISASGYAFNDATDKTLGSANSKLASLLRSARSYSNAQGNLIDWETYSTCTPTDWYEAMKKQGVLFLNRELSIDPNSTNSSSVWDAVVLKIIKTIFNERKQMKSGGVSIGLFGENLEQLKREIDHIHIRFQDAVPMRLLSFPIPGSPEFSAVDNLFESIDTLLLETDNKPINWFPDTSAPSAVSPAPGSGIGSSHPPLPKLTGKITSRLQLTSMDEKPDLDVGKFHRIVGKSGAFLLRSVDLDPSDPTLSSHIATFNVADPSNITITRHSTNPIFHCSIDGKTTTALEEDKPFSIKRGELLSFAGDAYTYRLDPYNFEARPKNGYHVETTANGGGVSANSSMHEDDLGPRTNEAKRPLSEMAADEAFGMPEAKKIKKPAGMDWMDDDEDDDGLEAGDFDYQPPKHEESAHDHVIDDGEGGGSEDEEAAFFADKRPLCMYGSTCYRKNAGHLAQFRHPPK